jgi:hypothetical protein
VGVAAEQLVPPPQLPLINFRYHIVSIIAIFLALALGMEIGAGVLGHVTVSRLEGSVRSLRSDLSDDRASISKLRDQNAQTSALIKNLAPRVTHQVLQDSQVLLVRAGGGQGWQGAVTDAIKLAGASDGGSIVFTDKWSSTDPRDQTQLAAALQTTLDPKDPAGSAAQYLGSKLSADDAPALVAALKDAGFLNVSAPASLVVPARLTDIVVFAAGPSDAWLTRFVQGAASRSATLVVAPSIDQLGTVDAVRHLSNTPKTLSTFDSASSDPSGVGCVLALRAAIDQQGGNFGTAPGLNYAPPTS